MVKSPDCVRVAAFTCSRNGFPDLWIRDVPVNRENAIVRSDTGPHLAAFRFFFSRD